MIAILNYDVLIMVSLYNIPDIDINTIKIHLDDIENSPERPRPTVWSY